MAPGDIDNSEVTSCVGLSDSDPRVISSWSILARRSNNLFTFMLCNRMIMNVRVACFRVGVEPCFHPSLGSAQI